MVDLELHVVSFSIPFPADYGGVIDVFYKIKALHSIGTKIHLHCFQYDREKAAELEQYCQSVHYYSRNLSPWNLLKTGSFIIESRKNQQLLTTLKKDELPILLEGLHCCSLLDEPSFRSKKIFVRSHNLEHDYYRHLAQVEKSFFKRWYFQRESKKLALAEARYYPKATQIFGISEKDTQYLKEKYGKGMTLPAFHQCDHLTDAQQTEPFAFYHGNLSVGENNEAALFLVNEVFNDLDYPLVIAGNAPSVELRKACQQHEQVTLKSDLTSEEILTQIARAQINVLPTFQNTGIKLKLIAALFQGKHCLVNSPMVKGTGLAEACTIADSATAFKIAIQQLAKTEFSEAMKVKRAQLLLPFDNKENAQQLKATILQLI